jgi:hypothetical protein
MSDHISTKERVYILDGLIKEYIQRLEALEQRIKYDNTLQNLPTTLAQILSSIMRMDRDIFRLQEGIKNSEVEDE